MTYMLIVPPASEPLSLAEAKAHLRLDTADEDDLVTALIIAARQIVEKHTGLALLTQTWRIVADSWPALPPVRLPLRPFASLAAVRVFDQANVATLLAPATYFVDAQPYAARLQFANTPPAPGRAIAGIELDVVAGFGAAPATVPEPLRLAIRMLVAHWFEARGDAAGDASPRQIPVVVEALLQPFRRLRLV